MLNGFGYGYLVGYGFSVLALIVSLVYYLLTRNTKNPGWLGVFFLIIGLAGILATTIVVFVMPETDDNTSTKLTSTKHH